MRTELMIAALAVLLGIGRPAAAEAPPPPAAPKEERQSLEAFGQANPACLEWSDGCGVCLRHDDGSVACSLPGIACQPVEPSCRRQKP